ncbi:MAG TPA: MFS transporter [Gaiellaceae bacterium]
MRRLLLLVAVLVFVDTMLYAALTPLLPHFAHEFGLSKTRAGVLVAAYAAGGLAGAGPGGFTTARAGARQAVLLGLTLVGLASLGFAFAGSFWTLFAARVLQGAGSSFTWAGALAWLLAAAPRERRGELLGTALGAAVFGALLGPVIGTAAALAGRASVFVALAGLMAVLGVWSLRFEPPGRGEAPSGAALLRAFRNRQFVGGMLAMVLPALLFGILSVLAPLHLAAAGWGAAAIGGVWLTGAGFEAVQAPLVGRWIDRRGRLVAVRVALACAALTSLGLAADGRPLYYVPLIVLASLSFGALFTPAFALLADGAGAAGLSQGIAFGLMNAAWAIGAVVGPAAGGALAGATSDWIPFVIGAAICVLALALARASSDHEGAAVLVDRLSGDAAGVGRE